MRRTKEISPRRRGETVCVPVVDGELIRELEFIWTCGCPLIATKDWEEGDEFEIGGVDFPLSCPEHGAPFTDEVLVYLPEGKINDDMGI